MPDEIRRPHVLKHTVERKGRTVKQSVTVDGVLVGHLLWDSAPERAGVSAFSALSLAGDTLLGQAQYADCMAALLDQAQVLKKAAAEKLSQ